MKYFARKMKKLEKIDDKKKRKKFNLFGFLKSKSSSEARAEIKVKSVDVREDKPKYKMPSYNKVVEIPSGRLAFGDEILYVYPIKTRSPWGVLTPLVEYPHTQEIFLRGEELVATIDNKRYNVEIYASFNPEKLVNKLAILACPKGLTEENPQAEGELDNWRLYFKLPSLSGMVEMTATKVISIPELESIIHPLLATRLILLTLKPSVVAIVGPAGSGKTTLLNSLLNKILKIFPQKFRVSIVEQIAELVIPDKAEIARSRAGPKTSVTTLLRQSMRYERPDILVLGELRGEEIWSWVEAGRLGIATLTTYHSPSVQKAVNSMAGLMRVNMPDADALDVLNLIDVFIVSKKYITFEGIKRGVDAVYVSDGRKLYAIYSNGIHMPEKAFLEFIPARIMVGDSEQVYDSLKILFRVKVNEIAFSELETLEFK
ncbi:MAG: hypothetical protein DRZ80_02310 [Thermoprotei archaeon]|nr:MAG: hypothetical protein DRZ80_02310 [Thermoprotei archaeon]